MAKKSYSRKGTRIKSSRSKSRGPTAKDLTLFKKALAERFQNEEEQE